MNQNKVQDDYPCTNQRQRTLDDILTSSRECFYNTNTIISRQLNIKDLKNLRLVNKTYSTLFNKYLFSEIVVRPNSLSFQNPTPFKDNSSLQRIGKNVHTARFKLRSEYRRYANNEQVRTLRHILTLLPNLQILRIDTYKTDEILLKIQDSDLVYLVEAIEDVRPRYLRRLVFRPAHCMTVRDFMPTLTKSPSPSSSSFSPPSLLPFPPRISISIDHKRLKTWQYITDLTLQLENKQNDTAVIAASYIHLHKFLQAFSPYIKFLSFHWHDRHGPFPFALDKFKHPRPRPHHIDKQPAKQQQVSEELSFPKLRVVKMDRVEMSAHQIVWFLDRQVVKGKFKWANVMDGRLLSGSIASENKCLKDVFGDEGRWKVESVGEGENRFRIYDCLRKCSEK